VGVQVIVLLFVARHRLEGIEGRKLAASLSRTAIASALMVAALVGLRSLWPGAGPRLLGVGGLTIAAATYVAAAVLLGSEEMRQLPRMLLQRGRGLDALSD
jgi:hypothetical protein